MIRRSAGLAAAALVAGALTAPVAAQAAETTLARQRGPTGVAAFGDRVVWSDSRGPGFGLVTSVAGGPAVPLPVARRRVPFDVDLGPDAGGRTVAVYSRCRREPRGGRFRAVVDFLPDYGSGRGCDVYAFDFERGRERRVRGASTREAGEYLPSIWGRRLVFARRTARRLELALVRLGDPRRRTTRLPGGHRGQGYTGPAGPIALDLRGRRLAYVWDLEGSCPSLAVDAKDDEVRSELWLQTIGERQTRLGLGCNTARVSAFMSPSLGAGRLSYVAAGIRQRFRTLDLVTGATVDAPAPACLTSMVRAQGVVYAARRVPCSANLGDPTPYYEITATAP